MTTIATPAMAIATGTIALLVSPVETSLPGAALAGLFLLGAVSALALLPLLSVFGLSSGFDSGCFSFTVIVATSDVTNWSFKLFVTVH